MGCFERVLHYSGEAIPYSGKIATRGREGGRIHVHLDGAVEVESPEDVTAEDIGKAVQKQPGGRMASEPTAVTGIRGRLVPEHTGL